MVGFINWREVPREGGKPDKRPTDPATGKNYNHLDEVNWRTYAEAKATGWPVGMVLTKKDPYFLIDIDNCWDGTKWAEGAEEIKNMFPGAAVEVSHSGNGLHIIGSFDSAMIGDCKHKFDYKGVSCEFYFHARYVAMGQGFTGSFETDCTNALINFIPLKTSAPTGTLPNVNAGAVEEYTGPVADDVLIKMMLNRNEPGAAVFGERATIRDLWECNIKKLRLAYPHSDAGVAYDASSADEGLMAHLAFWTGKDAGRMKRVFEMSKLVRKKWTTRPDYQKATIDFAVINCNRVYDVERKTEYDDLMSTADQVKFFNGCVYVTDRKAIMIPKGYLLSHDQFRVIYGGKQFVMQRETAKGTYNAWEAFTENRAYTFPKVRRTRFLPNVPHGEIVGDGVNLYYEHDIPTAEGDVSPFTELLTKMLPEEWDRDILLGWMASMVQNPGVKFLWSPVLQGTKGNGKGFISECLIRSVGEEYCWSVKPDKIDAQFNAFLQNRLLINVNEMNMFARKGMLDALKDYVTEKRQEVELKGVDGKMVNDYCANWLFATNAKDGVIKERDDRRFCVFFTAQQRLEDLTRDGMMGDYFTKLYAWAEAGGFAHVRHYLLNYQIAAERDPALNCFRAPDSTSTQEAIEASYSFEAQSVLDAVESQQVGFRGGWVSSYYVSMLLENIKARNKSTNAISTIMDTLGYVKRGRSGKNIPQENNMRPVLYSVPNCSTDYHISQGYQRGVIPFPRA